jgi:carboxylesterase type B
MRLNNTECSYVNRITEFSIKVTFSARTHQMPVIVFLHGGAFVVGSCEAMLYGPQVLLDREVRV